MTAIIHLKNGDCTTVSNLLEILVNYGSNFDIERIPIEKIENFKLSFGSWCTFVSDCSKVTFNADVIQFIEFKNKL